MKRINYDTELLDKYVSLNEYETSDFFLKLKHIEKLKAEHIIYDNHWSLKKCKKCPSYDGFLDPNRYSDWIKIGENIYRLGDFEWDGMVTHYLAKHQLPIFELDFYNFINTKFDELNLIIFKHNGEFFSLAKSLGISKGNEFGNIHKLTLTNKTKIKNFLMKLENIEKSKFSIQIDIESCSSSEEIGKLNCFYSYICWKNYSWSDRQIDFWKEQKKIVLPEVFYKDVIESKIFPPGSFEDGLRLLQEIGFSPDDLKKYKDAFQNKTPQPISPPKTNINYFQNIYYRYRPRFF